MPSKTKYLKILVVLFCVMVLSSCNKQDSLILSGIIESTHVDVNSEVSGKVIGIEKEEASQIKKGDILLTVDSAMQELTIKQQEAVVKIKEAKLDELRLGSRQQQIKQAEASVKAAKAKLDELKAGTRPEQINQAKSAVENAKVGLESMQLNYDYLVNKYNKAKLLYDSNAASEDSLDDIKLKMDTAENQLKASHEQIRSAQYQLELLENGPTSESIKAAQANYEQSKAQLDLLVSGSTEQTLNAAKADLDQTYAVLEQQKLVLSKYKIKAPADGTYISRTASIGDIINPGTNVGTISDLSDLWVNVFIPRRHLERVSLGQEIMLSSSGISIKGKITYIASEAEFTPKNVETSEAKENMVFKVKIKILDNIERLKPGMTIDVQL